MTKASLVRLLHAIPTVVRNVVKTVALLIAAWVVFLFLIPIGISMAEAEFGVQRIPPQTPIARYLFPLSCVAALWAALTIAIKRPSPRYARKSMVIATLGQGTAVGLAFGSVPVLLYVVIVVSVAYFMFRRALSAPSKSPF